jgi:TonB family protein
LVFNVRFQFALQGTRRNSMARAISAAGLLLVMAVSVVGATTTDFSRFGRLEDREREAAKAMIRASQFMDVPHIAQRRSCEEVQPPEALTTPDPLLAAGTTGRRVKVSFIIGIDGRVHSPLILESAGWVGDRRVLQTVRTWRYRPALCNGVPTEAEGKVEFSIR